MRVNVGTLPETASPQGKNRSNRKQKHIECTKNEGLTLDGENVDPNVTAGEPEVSNKRPKTTNEEESVHIQAVEDTLHFDGFKYLETHESTQSFAVESLASINIDSVQLTKDLQSIISAKGFFMLSGSKIFILNSDLTQHKATINLDDCDLEIIALNHDSGFLAAGDNRGVIHFIHVETQTVIYSQNLLSESPELSVSKAFQQMAFSCPKQDDGFEEFFVVLSNNMLLRFSNINLSSLESFVRDGDISAAMDVKRSIIVEKISLNETHPEGISLIEEFKTGNSSNLLTIGKGDSGIVIWTRAPSPNADDTFDETCKTDQFMMISENFSLGYICKARIAGNGRFLFSLNNSSNLEIWDTRSLICLHRFENTGFSDFEILTNDVRRNDFRIIAIKKSKPGCEIHLVDLPSFNHVYSLITRDPLSLACLQGPASEVFNVFLHLKSEDDKISIKSIKLADPSSILKQLVSKSKFGEAEAFAKKHDLELESFLKAKLGNILATSFKNDGKILDLTSIINDLKNIKDDAFVIDFCVNSIFDRYEDNVMILHFAQDLSYQINERMEKTSASSIAISFVFKLLKKLVTFRMVYKNFDAEKWRHFRSCNLVNELQSTLASGKIYEAGFIWDRHSYEERFVEKIGFILSGIPLSINPDLYVPWLKDHALPKIDHSIDNMITFQEWTLNAAKQLEFEFEDPLPAYNLLGIFGKKIKSSKRFGELLTPSYFVDKCLSRPQPQDFILLSSKIRLLQEQLEDIIYLRNNFNYAVKLVEYAEISKSSIAITLLTRENSVELLQQAIDGQMIPYVEKHGLFKDEVLFEYGIRLLEQTKSVGSVADKSFIEDRLTIVLDNMESVDMKSELIIQLFRQVTIPWSNAIDALLSNIDSVKASQRFNELTELRNLMKLKQILFKYGVDDFNISDSSMANGYLRMILSNFDNPGALKDGLQIASAYHHLDDKQVYITRLRYVSFKVECQEEHVKFIIDAIPDLIVRSVFSEYLSWASDFLDEICDNFERTDILKYEQILLTAYLVSKLAPENIDISISRRFIEAFALFSEFKIVASSVQVRDQDSKLKLIEEFLINNPALMISQDPIDSLKSGNMDLLRLAEILHISEEQLVGQLGIAFAIAGNIRQAIQSAKELLNLRPSNTVFSWLMKVLRALFARYSDSPSHLDTHIIHDWMNLSQSAMLVSWECLNELLDMFKNLEILSKTYDQCQSGDYELLLKGDVSNSELPSLALCEPYGNHLFENKYYENSLVMKTEETVSLATDFLFRFFRPKTKTSQKESSGAKQTSTSRSLMDHLYNNRSYQTCLRTYQLSVEYSLRFQQFDPSNLNDFLENDIKLYYSLMGSSINKMLAHPHIDGPMTFCFMISLPQKAAFDGIKSGLASVNNEFNRLGKIAGIGLGAATLWQQRAFTVQLEILAKNSRWWNQFNLLNISFEEDRFRNDDSYLRSMIAPLLDKTGLDILTVLEFAADYNIEDDFAIMAFTKKCIMDSGITNEECFSKITGVSHEVSNRTKFLETLKDLQQMLSPYNYERIRFIFETILKWEPEETVAKKGMAILDILLNYSRICEPGEEEILSVLSRNSLLRNTNELSRLDFFFDNFPEAKTRLPYHELVMNPWNILVAELSEVSVYRLVPLALPLSMPSDKFYLVVINNMLQRLRNDPNIDLTSSNRLFSDIKSIMLKLKDAMTSLGTWLHIAEAFPPGQDRIQSYKTAQILVEKWQKQLNSMKTLDEGTKEKLANIEGLAIKLKKQLMEAEIEYLLRNESLEGYQGLMSDPQELIIKLYSDLCKKEIRDRVGNETLDLHHVCDNIAAKSGLELSEIKKMLFQDWVKIPVIYGNNNLLPSIRFQYSLMEIDEETSEHVMQQKLAYILSKFDIQESVNLLLKIAYDSSQKIATSRRIRALCLLFKIASDEEISVVHSAMEVKEYLRMLFYLIDCEELRISVRARELYIIEKGAFARSLWLNRGHEPKVIQFICNLLLDFQEFEDVAFWDNLISKLLQFNEIRVAAGILNRASTIPELSRLQKMPEYWQTIFSVGFSSITTRKDITFCCELSEMLISCGFTDQIEIKKLFKDCQRIARSVDFAVGATCLLTLGNICGDFSKVEVSLAGCIDSLEGSNIIEILKSMKGPEFKILIEKIYLSIDERKLYEWLLSDSTLFLDFVNYLIREDRVDNLLETTIQTGMIDRAEHLLASYYEYWTDRFPVGENRNLIEFYRQNKAN